MDIGLKIFICLLYYFRGFQSLAIGYRAFRCLVFRDGPSGEENPYLSTQVFDLGSRQAS